MVPALALVLAAYLVGSVSFAVVVSRVFGLPDPPDYGSGNPGATNVLRTGNKAAALITLVGDGLKGFVAVVAAMKLAPMLGAADWAVPAAAVTATGELTATTALTATNGLTETETMTTTGDNSGDAAVVLPAGFAENPGADADDHPRLLRDGDEHAG